MQVSTICYENNKSEAWLFHFLPEEVFGQVKESCVDEMNKRKNEAFMFIVMLWLLRPLES